MNQVERSENDSRKYRLIQLENGLEAMLISNMTDRIGSACLTLNVGSYGEPVPGLAHFIEHLLSLGSSKYPKENVLDELVKGGSGSYNAFSDTTMTSYFFNCNVAKFDQSLDVFAHFFIEPLFDPQYVDREISAIDEEFQLNSIKDDKLLERGIAQYYVATHPGRCLAEGNAKTLSVPYIRQECIQFFNRYYSANIMKLVILAPRSLAELECLVRRSFSSIKNNNVQLSHRYGYMFNPINKHITSINETYQCTIVWEFPSLKDRYNKVYNLVCWLLNHKGSGSLFSTLYQRRIITQLKATLDTAVDYTRLWVNVDFTIEGWTHNKCIVNILEQYLELVYKANYIALKELYDGIKTRTLLEYKYFTVSSPSETVESLSSDWVEKELCGTQLISHKYLLPAFTPRQYERLKSFINSALGGTRAVFTFSRDNNSFNKELHLPLTLPKAYPLINVQYMCSNILGNKPLPLYPSTELYWKHSIKYESPKIHIICTVCNLELLTVRHVVIRELLLLMIRGNTELLRADLEDLGYDIQLSNAPSYIKLEVMGYLGDIIKVVAPLVSAVVHWRKILTAELVTHFKKEYTRLLTNVLNNTLQNKTQWLIEQYTFMGYYSVEELLCTLGEISMNDLLAYDLLASNIKLYGFINGNADYTLAKAIGDLLLPLVTTNRYIMRHQLKPNTRYIFTSNDASNGSCCRTCVRFGYIKRTHDGSGNVILTYLNILVKLLHQEYFHLLRTQEQLAYFTDCQVIHYGIDIDNTYTTCDFIIVSHTANGQYLYQRTLQFINEFRLYLMNLSSKFVCELIDAVMSDADPPYTLAENTKDVFKMIVRGHIQQRKRPHITKATLINFYNDWFTLDRTNHWVAIIN